MPIKASLILVVTAASLAVVSTASFANPGRHHMAIINANTGKTIYDDGKLDGKACAVGSKAYYNPVTGTFKKVQAAKCNF
jgi:hypothetical protein